MSSTNPREHDRSDKDYGTLPSRMKPKHRALHKAKEAPLQTLKKMVSEPASKEWFSKYKK